MKVQKGTLKQVLLITDGCSNQGEDPIAVATLLREYGITVNVIGIIQENDFGHNELKEIEGIASAGGGISEIVYTKQLLHTVQMVTRKAMNQTIQGFVNKELQHILGDVRAMEDLPPEKRGQVLEVIEEITETVDLEVLILIDTSASMKDKLEPVKEALLDLQLSLNARMGNHEFALFVFPGRQAAVDKLIDWTTKLHTLTGVFSQLHLSGITPTGPALREAMDYFHQKRSLRGRLEDDEQNLEEYGM
jgi:Ca-activated chloride channel homolog